MEQDLCSADDLLRGEAPRVTQVAENGLHIKGKMNDGEPPPLTCIPFPAYNVDKGLTPLNNIFCSILHRDLEFTQNLGLTLFILDILYCKIIIRNVYSVLNPCVNSWGISIAFQ